MSRNIKKILFISLIGMIAFLVNLVTVNAEEAKDSIVVNTTEKGKGNNPLGVDRTFAVKKDSNGKYMYCMDYHMLSPVNTTYKNQGKTSDNGVAYIMTIASDDKNDDEFFVSQMALWIYLLDKNLMQDSSIGSIKVYREAVYNKSNDNNKVALEIRDIVAKAKSAKSSNTNSNLSVQGNTTFTLKDGVYKTSIIKVNTTASDYEVTLQNAPASAKVEKTNGGFIVSVPSSSIENGGVNFKAVVTANQTEVSAYVYNDPNGVYQPVVGPYTTNTTLKDEINFAIEVNVVSIMKMDKDTNELVEGAKLQLLDKDGNIIEEWISNNDSHLIFGLEKGKYTIREIEAPNGYIKANDKTFNVTTDSGVETINFYNEKEKKEIIVPEDEEITNVEVESTGMNKSVLLTVIGILAITSGITILYRKTKESNK